MDSPGGGTTSNPTYTVDCNHSTAHVVLVSWAVLVEDLHSKRLPLLRGLSQFSTRRRPQHLAFALWAHLVGGPGGGHTSNCRHAVDRSTSPSPFGLASLAVLAEDTHKKARSFRSVLSMCVHHSNSTVPGGLEVRS